MVYKGIAVSPGLGLGKCLILKEMVLLSYSQQNPGCMDTEVEKNKVKDGILKAVMQLDSIKAKIEDKGAVDRGEIIEAQIMLLQDPTLLKNINSKIEQGMQSSLDSTGICGIEAVQRVIDEQAEMFGNIDDAYLKERAQDVRDIGRRIINAMTGIQEMDLLNLSEGTILVGHNITPSQMASIDRKRVKAIISEVGGRTSHTAILANSMEIPAVFGCSDICMKLSDGMLLSVNGSKGLVETELTLQRLEVLQTEIEKYVKQRAILEDMSQKPTLTLDGKKAELFANIMSPLDVVKVQKAGADGIGLYRTEFLFMDRKSAPGEEEQFQAYRQVVQAMQGKPVIIRTMDIGGDKNVEYLNLPKEENPFIGYRAIRICLNDKALFKTQLRAILRASAYGRTLIMFPMIGSIEELRSAKLILYETKEELNSEGIAFDGSIPVGIMVEVPSAAVMADILIKEADFFSIGTNDLTQYTLAVDRMNENLSGLYNSFQPGVLRLIKNVISAVDQEDKNKFAGMCGEMAGDPYATILLLGLGLHEFSVNPSSVLKIKKIISLVDMAYARKVVEKVMILSTAAEIEEYLHKVTKEVAGDIL